MRYTNYVVRKNKKPLRTFLKFYFNARCTCNMPGTPSKASSSTTDVGPKGLRMQQGIDFWLNRLSVQYVSIGCLIIIHIFSSFLN